MLKKFKVKNFTCFDKELVFDLSNPKAYEYLSECISSEGIIRSAVVHGTNGVGKSNLGLAIFDIFEHLTDFTVYQKIYRTFLCANLNPEENPYAEFEYSFQFGTNEVVYSYAKTTHTNLAFEQLVINGKAVVYFDRKDGNTEFCCTLPGTESLKKVLSDSSISVLKYIKTNTERELTNANTAFDDLFDFVNKMLFFKCLEERVYISERPKNDRLFQDIIEAGMVEDFQGFLRDAGIDVHLEAEGDGSRQTIVNVFKNKRYPLEDVWSTGTESLTLFYCWLMRMRKGGVSFLFIDEFDAFYHFRLSRRIIEKLRETPVQFVVTTHNPATITNKILRPDCYFLMDKAGILSLAQRTPKELREAHNLEKMFKAKAFDAQ